MIFLIRSVDSINVLRKKLRGNIGFVMTLRANTRCPFLGSTHDNIRDAFGVTSTPPSVPVSSHKPYLTEVPTIPVILFLFTSQKIEFRKYPVSACGNSPGNDGPSADVDFETLRCACTLTTSQININLSIACSLAHPPKLSRFMLICPLAISPSEPTELTAMLTAILHHYGVAKPV